MNTATFSKQKQDALERMREMNSRSTPQKTPKTPQTEHKKDIPKTQKAESLFEGINIPFLDKLTKDGDATLILGILLLLLSEKADKKLLFALIYILL